MIYFFTMIEITSLALMIYWGKEMFMLILCLRVLQRLIVDNRKVIVNLHLRRVNN